ncbi:unnamed protein product [Linum tenue]|uniref:Uncharacterized protein n=1 Tax=Linum tenue TaxID=586396 RepID=A0AAV0JKI0_9ROSI|nr:unnamed protein product [Linum tenue]
MAVVENILLVFLVFMAANAITGEAVFGIDMNPCTISPCVAACKAVLREKYASASCFHKVICMCFG